ncbi:hypothetical protein HPB51_012391 [Rhipicephalus microplus]|uniref:Uncharacterized protein n=1 Tax=Rhipicephalus microplus TaxID=6941 RepID=A0A9J6E8N9_RHIMP|nr:hypothetical protein HPB51_012391 [Rhipicephalus microplus]
MFTRSQRRGSRESGDVITIAAKEVRCVFIEDFEEEGILKRVCNEASGSSTSSPQNVTRSVLGFPPVTSERPGSFEGDSSVSHEKPEHQEVLEQVHHRASEGSLSTSAPRNATPSVFVFPSVTSEGPGSFEGGTSPSHQTRGPSTTQDMVASPSENVTSKFPPEKSQEFPKSSSSQEVEASSEKTESSRDHPPSPNAFEKLWRSFSFRKTFRVN